MNLRRIRIALTAWYVVVLLGIISAVGIVSYIALHRALSNEVDRSLVSGAQGIAAQMRAQPERAPDGDAGRHNTQAHATPDDPGGLGHEAEEHAGYELRYLTGTSGDAFYVILRPDGSTLLNPLNVDLSLLPISGALDEVKTNGEAWRTTDTKSGDYRLLLYAVRQNDNVVAIIEAGRSLVGHDRDLANLATVLLATSAGGLALAVVGGFYVAGRALRPASEAFNKQREFVADASHELRTPLTLIRASAEAIQRGRQSNLSSSDREALADIVSETDRMSVLVEDLLTLAKLDEKRLPLRVEAPDLSAMLRDTERWARTLPNGRSISIDVEVPIGLIVKADSEAITRVLRILVDNALRYAGAGGRIEIRGIREGSHAAVSISDSGPGLEPSALEHVFDRFYRADLATNQATGGSGLGLAIAKGIVEAHGGHISVDSTPGHGASFRFTLETFRST